jgi:hypothetical protein
MRERHPNRTTKNMLAAKQQQLAMLQVQVGQANAPADLPVNIVSLQNETAQLDFNDAGTD